VRCTGEGGHPLVSNVYATFHKSDVLIWTKQLEYAKACRQFAKPDRYFLVVLFPSSLYI
jgi:hypothetical protein